MTAAAVPAPAATTPSPWSLPTRIAFRFCVLYFTTFCLTTQVLPMLLEIPGVDVPDLAFLPPIQPLVAWVAAHLFHAKLPLVTTGSGSGDKTFDWILTFCVLVFALAGTALWSVLDRRRTSYPALHRWFWLLFCFCLASQMFGYGFDKVIPLQMPFPSLSRLVEPYGNFSPMGVLWYSVGAAPAYEIFAGCAEVLAGILILVPRTRTLGALLCLADSAYIFSLNMTYDVPVKLFAFHLILLSLVVLAPDFPRLADLFFLNRPTAPRPASPLFRSRRANQVATSVLILFALWLFAANLIGARISWYKYGGGAPKPALYGIWNVDTCILDGQPHPPLLTDPDRPRSLLFDRMNSASLVHMNETRDPYTAAFDPTKGLLTLTALHDPAHKSVFILTRPAPDRLTLDGTLGGRKAHLQLHRVDLQSFLLISRGFHWVQEYPVNR
jgi:hypothetical protein